VCLLILEPARTKMSPKRRAVKIASLYESRAAPFGHGAGCFAVTVIIAFKRQKADQRVWKIGKRIVENDAGDARCIWEGESAGIVPACRRGTGGYGLGGIPASLGSGMRRLNDKYTAGTPRLRPVGSGDGSPAQRTQRRDHDLRRRTPAPSPPRPSPPPPARAPDWPSEAPAAPPSGDGRRPPPGRM
jgi:hypothetical protein